MVKQVPVLWHGYQRFFFLWRCGPTRAIASSFLRFLDHTQRRITVGMTPLDERSARRIDLYLTTHNICNRQTSMPPVGFEPTISAGERPHTYVLDLAPTWTGISAKNSSLKHNGRQNTSSRHCHPNVSEECCCTNSSCWVMNRLQTNTHPQPNKPTKGLTEGGDSPFLG